MLCIRTCEFIHLVTGSLWPLTNISLLLPPPNRPLPGSHHVTLCFWSSHICDIRQYLYFSVWLILLIIIRSFLWIYMCVYIYISHFLYLFTHRFHIFPSTMKNDNEHSGADTPSRSWFHVLRVYIQKWDCWIMRYFYFECFGDPRSVSHSGCTHLHPHYYCTRAPVSPHPHLHSSRGFVIATFLTQRRWYLVVVLICFALRTGGVGHCFISLLPSCVSLERYLFSSSAHF